MTKKETTNSIKELTECTGTKREYKFYNFDGRVAIEYLSEGDRLHQSAICPRDGVRLIVYAGDPHNVIECPNCHYNPPEKYSREEDLKDLDKKIKMSKEIIKALETTRSIVANPQHPIVLANLEDKAMFS